MYDVECRTMCNLHSMCGMCVWCVCVAWYVCSVVSVVLYCVGVCMIW